MHSEDEKSLIIQEYSKNPINNFRLKEFTVSQHEGNFICWDEITVYLLIDKKNIIKNYSFDGNCSSITKASASFLAEFIIWKKISEILNWDHQTLEKEWLEVSKKRRRAMVIALLATRNAIHIYQKDWKRDEFDDLIND